MSGRRRTKRPTGPSQRGPPVRFYDPKLDAWQSTWISATQKVVKVFVGRKVGEDIVLESRTVEGHPLKWIFSDITPDSFRWHSEESHDDGKTGSSKRK